MHNAPSVVYPLGRSSFHGRVLLVLWLTGLVVLAWWWRVAPAFDWRLGGALAAVLAAGAAAALGWLHSPVGQLRWDGQAWCWERHGGATGSGVRALSVALDFQRVLLLRLENHDQTTLWLWAGRAAMPERWLDLRRAVYSRRRGSAALLPQDSLTPLAAVDAPVEPRSPHPHS